MTDQDPGESGESGENSPPIQPPPNPEQPPPSVSPPPAPGGPPPPQQPPPQQPAAGYAQQQPPPQQPPAGYPQQQPPPPGYPNQQQAPAGYPPQQPPPGGYPPPAPAKSNSGCLKIGLIVAAVLVVFGLLGVGCLAFGANQVVDEIDKQTGKADTSDYELTGPECSSEEFVGPKASGTIKNTSGEAQGFEVSVRFTDADGNLISEDSTFTDSIDVDQTANWDVSSFESATGDVKCEVAEVNYSLFDG